MIFFCSRKSDGEREWWETLWKRCRSYKFRIPDMIYKVRVHENKLFKINATAVLPDIGSKGIKLNAFYARCYLYPRIYKCGKKCSCRSACRISTMPISFLPLFFVIEKATLYKQSIYHKINICHNTVVRNLCYILVISYQSNKWLFFCSY